MRYSELTDNELITQFLKGDESGLEKLILRHQKKVFTSILLLVKDKELAEDLFQETFIKVINTLRSGNYHEEGKFLPWVVRIGHNLVIDYFRKQKRMPMVRDTDDFSIMDSLKLTDDNIEDKLIIDQIHIEIRKLIEHLPLDQREVVIMRHYADMSFKEIAETTNVSINTSLGRMRYALINLRKLIQEKQLVLVK
ncbi:MAG TPA: sigma-70 family RNA polymerase sigma factor [Bacteroidia bacterium]|nr:sigma-70 family RNA polymerase sigma factor [Bacteroidia bacterium]